MEDPAQPDFELRPPLRVLLSRCTRPGTKTCSSIFSTGDIIPGYSGDWYNSSTKNFGPRLGLTWSPRADSRTTPYSGSARGYFYGPGQTEDQLQPEANDRIGRTICGSNPLNIYPLDINAIYASYNINDPNLGFQPRAYYPATRSPRECSSYTASVQQTLPGNTVLTVAYVGSQGRNLFLRSITNLITDVGTNPTTGAAIVHASIRQPLRRDRLQDQRRHRSITTRCRPP